MQFSSAPQFLEILFKITLLPLSPACTSLSMYRGTVIVIENMGFNVVIQSSVKDVTLWWLNLPKLPFISVISLTFFFCFQCFRLSFWSFLVYFIFLVLGYVLLVLLFVVPSLNYHFK